MLSVAVAACLAASLALPDRALAQLSDYLLGPGDRLSVTVFGHNDLSGQMAVSANGSIAMPLVGQVPAATLTVSELQKNIVALLDRDFVVEPRVSIEVLGYRPFFILGEVNRPGKYDYIVGLSVRKAIAMAEGYTRRAKHHPVLLIRDDREGNPVRYRASLDSPVYPGDTIEVVRRLF
ncbi:MAG: polysaccharide biosynthesis/export family protein [Alphaproteobacteria bacterium]|jgi:polysaccharide export outer membrane protein|nr:polysaccharide biosynthesis/export family protein [Alphaproteobacteria bacterium]MDP6566045.1 polysaccharide biosynthesis/export family protein [Alphaproteobacteria bacterium]